MSKNEERSVINVVKSHINSLSYIQNDISSILFTGNYCLLNEVQVLLQNCIDGQTAVLDEMLKIHNKD